LYFISKYDESSALLFDAKIYFEKAKEIFDKKSYVGELILFANSRFIDIGYPMYLSIVAGIFNSINILIFQVSNYILLFFSGLLIGKSLDIINKKNSIFNY